MTTKDDKDQGAPKPPPKGDRPFGDLLGRATKIAGDVAAEVQKNAKTLQDLATESDAFAKAKAAASQAGRQFQKTDAYAQAKEAADNVRTSVMDMATRTGERAQRMGEIGRRLIATLNTATTDVRNRPAFLAQVSELFEDIAPQLDAKAQALGFGYLAEAGAGVAGTTGVEILYVRGGEGERPLLKVARIDGKSARLAVGASSNAYAVCMYGPPLILGSATKRRGADVEVIVASLGFFQATSALADPETRAGGWLAGIGAGLNLGIPILSDFTAFELEESIAEKLHLTAEEVEKLEKPLEAAPDRTTRRKLARAL